MTVSITSRPYNNSWQVLQYLSAVVWAACNANRISLLFNIENRKSWRWEATQMPATSLYLIELRRRMPFSYRSVVDCLLTYLVHWIRVMSERYLDLMIIMLIVWFLKFYLKHIHQFFFLLTRMMKLNYLIKLLKVIIDYCYYCNSIHVAITVIQYMFLLL